MIMTYGDKIRSMNDEELANFLCKCVIPKDECESIFVYGVGHFEWEEDLADKLKEEISESEV